jgi:hypothetical protein
MQTERAKHFPRGRCTPAESSALDENEDRVSGENTFLSGAADTSNLPTYVDRRTGAALVTSRLFPVSRRTLETWPLVWRRVNGRAICRTAELLEFAQSKLDAASPVRGGPG